MSEILDDLKKYNEAFEGGVPRPVEPNEDSAPDPGDNPALQERVKKWMYELGYTEGEAYEGTLAEDIFWIGGDEQETVISKKKATQFYLDREKAALGVEIELRKELSAYYESDYMVGDKNPERDLLEAAKQQLEELEGHGSEPNS